MKEYDRISKKWIGVDEMKEVKKKREKCKGGREHDFVEVLPYGVEAGPNYAGSPEPYYEAEHAIADFKEKKYAELAEIGIIIRHKPWRPTPHRVSMCAVCGKRKYL